MIAGIDEAGRGPIAGPVCAAAVILPDNFNIKLLNDSKKLTASRREEARREIMAQAVAWGIGWASHAEIDRINILRASLLAMKRAFDEMMKKSCLQTENITAITDGLYVPDIPVPGTAMVKADAKVPQVMAASIMAKTARDSYMEEMAALYPLYGYEKHKGYPTAAHRKAVIKYGPSPIQRLTFAVKK